MIFTSESFDKIVSVGMIEHVGKITLQSTLKRSMHYSMMVVFPFFTALLPTDGATNSWIEKYIFPGGYVPPLMN